LGEEAAYSYCSIKSITLDLGECNPSNLIEEWDKSPHTQEDFIAIKLNALANSIYKICN